MCRVPTTPCSDDALEVKDRPLSLSSSRRDEIDEVVAEMRVLLIRGAVVLACCARPPLQPSLSSLVHSTPYRIRPPSRHFRARKSNTFSSARQLEDISF